MDRFVQRARLPRQPVEHSAWRAGYPQSVRPYAIPSVTQFDNAGYVGGARLRHNNLMARGPGSATGPVFTGVYATDYTGFRQHLGRVFLAPSNDPSRAAVFARGYWAEGPRVRDVFAIRPLRNGILAAREDAEMGAHGGGGHGEAAHGAEGDHGPEGGTKEGGHE